MPIEYLNTRGISYEREYDTSRLSSIRVGGKASVIAFPKTRDELAELVSYSYGNNIKFVIIGKCTNTYFSDNGYNGLIISTSRLCNYLFGDHSVTADCGCSLRSIIRRAMEMGLDLAPELSGIPGSVGGAVRMNAGAYGRSVGELVSAVEVFDPDKSRMAVLSREEMQFAYRSSLIIGKRLAVLSVKFELKNDARENILSRITEFSDKRSSVAPKYASLGSFFKAFPNEPASRLIDLAGMKGERIGDAAVYDRHAGYIVNMGRATAAEVNALAERVEAAVYTKFGKALVREVEFYE